MTRNTIAFRTSGHAYGRLCARYRGPSEPVVLHFSRGKGQSACGSGFRRRRGGGAPRSRGGEPRVPVPPRTAQGPAAALPRASLGRPSFLGRPPARTRWRRVSRLADPRRDRARLRALDLSAATDQSDDTEAPRGNRALGGLVLGGGIGAVATEIPASRLLAPYFGSSTIVWANLIGIVLAALSLGYWLRGGGAGTTRGAELLWSPLAP